MGSGSLGRFCCYWRVTRGKGEWARVMVGVGLVNILNEAAPDYYGRLFAMLEHAKGPRDSC